MLSRDRRQFFLTWLRSPMGVGNPFASGKGLSNAMAAQLDVSSDEYVVELGAGNGAVTRAILAAGIAPEKLIIIERDKRFRKVLNKKFPHLHIELGDASDIPAILKSRGINQVAAIVSSLPLLAMPHSVRHDIVNACFRVLKKDGQYIQYTYGLLSPVPERNQREIGIKGKVAKRIWLNLPPARVWCYEAVEAMA
jgi:phosphatidylethanolamine/phosphatidyl-N-methylethanolamine N-methyltransferase